MKVKSLLIIVFVYIISCSSTVKAPKWYINPPENKKGMRYTAGTATADDLQTAFDMARLAAESDLAKELKSQLNGAMDRERNVLKGRTTLDRFQATVENVIAADITGATVSKRDYNTKGSMYNAFVILEYNENKMEERLLAQLEAEKELYEELKAVDMLKQMRERVDQYKKSGY
tara:strand:+ start:164 stop:685 length:522 start_codon:yes stop_codon:yes gene_type:complete